MLSSPLTRLAGPLALTAGVLIVVAQLVMLPFDPKDHVATSTDPVFQIGGGIYMAGFITLMLALIGAYGHGLHKAGRLGTTAFVAAVVGTMMLGGDLWFETFAVPWIADEAPAAFDTDPTMVLATRRDRQLPVLRNRMGAVRHRRVSLRRLPEVDQRRDRRRWRGRIPGPAGAVRNPARTGHRLAGRLDDQVAVCGPSLHRRPRADTRRAPRRFERSRLTPLARVHDGRPSGRPSCLFASLRA